MKRLLKWFLMLNKRLYKKAAFVCLLCLIPVCTVLFGIAAKNDSGFLHIVLANADSGNKEAEKIIDDLIKEDSIIHFTKAENSAKAIDLVEGGQADAAWIFSPDTQERIEEFVQGKRNTERIVSVIVREQNVFLRLSEEKIFSVLYERCAKEYAILFARTNISELDSVSNSELIEYIEDVTINEDLFELSGSDGRAPSIAETNYLLSPIKGLFGILVVLCGMAAHLYYMQDEKIGTFSWVPENKRIYTAFACLMIAIVNICIVIFISLSVSGITNSVIKELIALLPYSVCCALFCLTLGEILPNIRLYGAVIPLFTVIMIAVCPVFFDFRSLMWLQMIFPPTYYVNIMYNSNNFLYMPIYSVVCVLLIAIIRKLKYLYRVKRR